MIDRKFDGPDQELPLGLRIGLRLFVLSVVILGLGMAGLFFLGMEFHDAEQLSNILGVLLYLVVFLWAFAARSLWRVWAVLVPGGALLAGAAHLLQSRLLA